MTTNDSTASALLTREARFSFRKLKGENLPKNLTKFKTKRTSFLRDLKQANSPDYTKVIKILTSAYRRQQLPPIHMDPQAMDKIKNSDEVLYDKLRLKRAEAEVWGVHLEGKRVLSWDRTPPETKAHVKNLLHGSPIELQIAYKRAFGLSLIEFRKGERVFDLVKAVQQFDGVIKPYDVENHEDL